MCRILCAWFGNVHILLKQPNISKLNPNIWVCPYFTQARFKQNCLESGPNLIEILISGWNFHDFHLRNKYGSQFYDKKVYFNNKLM